MAVDASIAGVLGAARAFFDELNHSYAAVHRTKEDLFWAVYMALASSDDAAFARAETTFKEFVSDPAKLRVAREHVVRLETLPSSAERDALLHGLRGWVAVFEANIVDDPQGKDLQRQIIEAEAELFAKRRSFEPKHINERGQWETATLGSLATNLSVNPVEERRKSSFDAFRAIERWVLDNGFLDIVRLRNRFARALGYGNFFAYKSVKGERMSQETLAAILDDFLARTEAANTASLEAAAARHGRSAVEPWNLRFFASGDVTRRFDPYLPFSLALRRWVESFRRLAIRFRGATMQLDLLDRAGKHQNGFCHAPICAWTNEQGEWVPAQINFTSNAVPDQIGSGQRALATLFHEGGHAAHFANVTQNSPCFSQEYPPTSMALAETQSMFCDSLLGDADWLVRYAHDPSGQPPPRELLRDRIAAVQPMRAFDERAIAVVPCFEMALYRLADEELTPGRVLALARETERRVLGIESPRPLLAIPHLLNQESAASYQGYLLAHMAVYQTRAFFLREHGYLTDNPAIGPALAGHYWAPGNSVDHDTTLRSLTGEGFSAKYLADQCNRSVGEAWAEAEALLDGAASRRYPKSRGAGLDAYIRVVHGDEVIADSSGGEEAMCRKFEEWIRARYPDAR
jgi:oligoendopeptidase F